MRLRTLQKSCFDTWNYILKIFFFFSKIWFECIVFFFEIKQNIKSKYSGFDRFRTYAFRIYNNNKKNCYHEVFFFQFQKIFDRMLCQISDLMWSTYNRFSYIFERSRKNLSPPFWIKKFMKSSLRQTKKKFGNFISVRVHFLCLLLICDMYSSCCHLHKLWHDMSL